jgi:PKD repeat protein
MARRQFFTSMGAALLALASIAHAQTPSGKTFQRVNKPLKSATLDMATGTLSMGPLVHDRAASTIVDFANVDLSGFVGVDTGGGFCEWFDAGVKGSLPGDGTALVDSGNVSDLMNSILFSYCSAVLSPASGGVGGSVKLGFYEGYVTGGGAATTAAAAFTLTGLPGNTASSSFSGGYACYFMRIQFASLIAFADGPIGYSWKFLDVGTDAVMAGTFPFLSCVVSCSGATDQVDGQGMDDRIDEYCPPGTLRSSFTFGTTSGSFTSMSMQVEEVTDLVSTVVNANSATFPNPDILHSSSAVLGASWSASLTLGLARTKGSSWTVFFGSSMISPPNGVSIPQVQGALNFGAGKGGRMLLCSINTLGASCSGAHTGVLGSVSSSNCGGAVIPMQLTLVCNPWCAQAVVLGPIGACDGGGNARLTSAISGVVGTIPSFAAQPEAAFTGTPDAGITPLTVDFASQSTGLITSYEWLFGDGERSTEASPSHVYDVPGTYSVTLTVSGPGGFSTSLRPGHVTVTGGPPVADFVGAPLTGFSPLTVNFTNQSTGTITCHSWNFGDGTTSSAASPSHVYAIAGKYTVKLTETGPGGSHTRTRPGYVNVSFAQQSIPTDANPCNDPLTVAEFNSWFDSGSVSLNGLVKPANSVTFPNTPNCSFYKWSEQMFLWLTSPATPQYGGGGGLVMTTQAFFDVSPDALGQLRFVPHLPGMVVPVGLATMQTGSIGLPIVFETGTHRVLQVLPTVASRAGKPLVMNGAGVEVEVGSIRTSPGRKPVLVDTRGNEIQSPKAILRSRGDTRIQDFERRLQRLEALEAFDRSSLVQRIEVAGNSVVLDTSGRFPITETGQADDNVLMAQNGSLVYYAISANNVFALYRTMLGATVPAGRQFPVTDEDFDTDPTTTDLNDILAFATANNQPPVIDSEALAVEIKSSWVKVQGLADPDKFIQMTGVVPKFNANWERDGTETVRLAMVGLHIAGSAKGHPEMLWGTFEHLSNAPAATYSYAGGSGPVTQDTTGDWIFCANGSTGPFNEPHMNMSGDDIVAISPFSVSASNILRVMPWGLAGTNAGGNAQVIDINNTVRSLLHPDDVRRNYFHEGTTWTIGGAAPTAFNQVGTNKLENTTMETFSQGTMNCFDCHATNTTAVSFVFDGTAPLF